MFTYCLPQCLKSLDDEEAEEKRLRDIAAEAQLDSLVDHGVGNIHLHGSENSILVSLPLGKVIQRYLYRTASDSPAGQATKYESTSSVPCRQLDTTSTGLAFTSFQSTPTKGSQIGNRQRRRIRLESSIDRSCAFLAQW